MSIESMDNRRKTTRRTMRLRVLCWESTNVDKIGHGKALETRDISIEGLGFYSDHIYPIGVLFFVDIYLPGGEKPISATIKIMRVEAVIKREGYNVGSMFTHIAPDDRKALAAAIDTMNIYRLLETVQDRGASDLHLAVGCPPMIREEGRILRLSEESIQEGQVEAMLYPLLSSHQIGAFEQQREIDFAFSPSIDSRYRINMHWQKGFVEAAFRSIPTTINTLDNIGIPEATMRQFCSEKSGLVLIAGTTGSGKTTTLSAMINHINNEKEYVIITIEDPIEYIFKNNKSVIKQREIGSDTLSYAESLKRALRQDPDVICVSEILDADCLLSAMRAAETGHLVISTIHAPGAIQAIERVINLFPPEQASSVCQQLSSSLLGIVYQVLLPGKSGARVMASEILLNNSAMKFLIREKKYSQMPNVLQTGRSSGMYLLAHSLEQLLAKGLIERETAEEVVKTKSSTVSQV